MMRDFYFTFRSMTAAQQAAMVLLQYGIDSEFTRAPRQLLQMGCGYAVRVRKEDAERTGFILRQEGLRYERGVRVVGWTVDGR